MKKSKLVMCGIITLLGFATVQAAPVKNIPSELLLNCQLKDKVYTANLNYVLNKITPKQIPQVYFLKNKSKYMLVIDHVQKDAGAKAGWSSYLAPGKWSALAVSQTGFSVRCTISQQGKFYQGGCEKLLSVCQPMAGATINANGSYWVAENKSWQDFIKIMQEKGVVSAKKIN